MKGIFIVVSLLLALTAIAWLVEVIHEVFI